MKHRIKNWIRRIKYGIGCCDLAGYSYYISERIRDDLTLFKENMYSHPADMSFEEWESIIQEMIDGFDAFLQMDEFVPSDKEYKRLNKIHKRGMRTFIKYFRGLWT